MFIRKMLKRWPAPSPTAKTLAVSITNEPNTTNIKDKMKYAVNVSLIIVAFVTGFAFKTLMMKQNIDSRHETIKENRKLDEERIRKTETTYDHAWQQGDIKGMMLCFTTDAILISPRGDEAIGIEQIHKLFSNFLGSEAKHTKHTSRITRISFVTDDVAVVDGEAFIEGGEKLSDTVKNHRFTDILVRSGDVWLINQIRAYTK